MIVKANIKANPTINVNLEQGMGQGAMSPEDKAMLETLANRPSLTQYFDDAKSNVLYWNGETIGLESYENFYKVSDATPRYGDLQDYTIYVTYREIKSHSLITSELSIIGDNSAGYCTLGIVYEDSGPARTQIYAYVAYEDNSLGVSAGTYLSKYYEVSALDVGHPVYEKKVIKEDCLPDKVVESTDQVQNMLQFSGGDILNWDGKTQGLEVADANFYRVSAAMPTFEELSKVYSASSFIKSEYDWNRYANLIVNDYRDTEGYCGIDTSGLVNNRTICRVYYNENAAELTPGTYFYADETIYVDELVLEGYGKFVPVLKEECLPKSNAEAGTYGGFELNALLDPYYNIPNVTVDKYGRVTEASNSVLPKASAESDGYIVASDYVKFGYIPCYFNPNTSSQFINIPAGDTTTSNSYSAYTYYSTSDLTATDLPIPLVVYAYGEYTDASGDVYKIPLDWKIKKQISSKSTYVIIYHYISVSLPQALDYDVYVKIYANYSMISFM